MNSQALNQRALEIQQTLTRENIPGKAALLGWNRLDLSKAAGVPNSTLSVAIWGKNKLSPKVARKLSLALATREVELYGSEPHCRRALEIQRTLTQENVAPKAALLGWNLLALSKGAGVPNSTLSDALNHRRRMTPNVARKVALALARREAELGVTL